MKMTENNLSTRLHQKLYIILANISLILLFYGIWEIKWIVIDIDNLLGITTKLTVTYWLGLSLITICSILVYLDKGLRNNRVFIFVLLVLGLFIVGLGIFTEENARISTSYYPPGEVKKILSDNYIDITTPYPLLSYRSWPGIHLISIYMLYLTNIDLVDLIRYMTLPWLIIFIFITLSIGKSFDLSSNKCFLLSFLAISSFWTSHHYYSPQSFAFLIYLAIFLFVTTIDDNMIKKCISIIMFSFLVITHLLTTVATLLSLFMALIYKKHMKINKEFILFCVIYVTWYIYLATTVLKWGVPDTIDRIMNMESISVVGSKLHPNSLTELLSKILQVAYIFIYMIPIGIYLFNYRKKDYRKKDYNEKTALNIILYWILGLVVITITVYGTEIFERLYLYASIPLACFMIISLKDYRHSNKFFIVIMIIFAIMIIPAHYGNEIRSITYTTELKGSEFLSGIIQHQSPYHDSYFYSFSSYVWYYNPDIILAEHHSFDLVQGDAVMNRTRYIVNSRYTNNILTFQLGYNPVQAWLTKTDNKLNLLYDNGEFDVYKNIQI